MNSRLLVLVHDTDTYLEKDLTWTCENEALLIGIKGEVERTHRHSPAQSQ